MKDPVKVVCALSLLFFSSPRAEEVSKSEIEKKLFEKTVSISLQSLFKKKSLEAENKLSTAQNLIENARGTHRKRELQQFIGKDINIPILGKYNKGKYLLRLYGVSIEMDLHGFYHNQIRINGIPFAFNPKDPLKKRLKDLELTLKNQIKIPEKKTSFHWTDLFISKAHAFFWESELPEYCEDRGRSFSREELRECMAKILTINAEGVVAIKVDFYDKDRAEDFDFLLTALESRLNSQDASTCRVLNAQSSNQAHENLSDQTTEILSRMAEGDTSGDNQQISEKEAVKAIFGDLAYSVDENDNDSQSANNCMEFIGSSMAVRINFTRRDRVTRVCQQISNIASECNTLYQKHTRLIGISRKYSEFSSGEEPPLSETFGDGRGTSQR